jgi:hypothetical protein
MRDYRLIRVGPWLDGEIGEAIWPSEDGGLRLVLLCTCACAEKRQTVDWGRLRRLKWKAYEDCC